MTARFKRRLAFSILTASVVLVSAIVLILRFGTKREPPVEPATTSILTGVPCEPPCWQGLSPGDEVEPADLVRLVAALPNVGPDRVWASDAGTGDDRIFVNWYWKQWPGEGNGYNNLTVMSNTLAYTWLTFDFELTVGSIVDKYGVPSAVNYTTSYQGDYVVLNMMYPADGTVVGVRIPVDHVYLEPSTQVEGIAFSKPAESVEDLLGREVAAQIDLKPWPGYGELEMK